jgi:hypothetical protein
MYFLFKYAHIIVLFYLIILFLLQNTMVHMLVVIVYVSYLYVWMMVSWKTDCRKNCFS